MRCMECNPKAKVAEAVGAQRRCASTPTAFGPLKCIVCHSDDIQAREVYEELKVEQDIVYVPIHVLVCQSCGERYYSRQTMRFLEDVEQKLQRKREGELELQELGKVLLYR